MKLISKFALLIVVLSLIYLIISGSLFSTSPFVIIIQLIAVGLSIWARRSFTSEQFSIHAEPGKGGLIEKGPYKYIRHPMYTSALLLIWSSVLGHFGYATVAVAILITFVTIVRMMTEEKLLREQFQEYKEYSERTKRVIPFLI